MSALSGLEGLIEYCSMSYFDPKHGLLGLGFGLFPDCGNWVFV